MCHAGSEDDDPLFDSEDELASSSSIYETQDDLDGIEAEYAQPHGWPWLLSAILHSPDVSMLAGVKST